MNYPLKVTGEDTHARVTNITTVAYSSAGRPLPLADDGCIGCDPKHGGCRVAATYLWERIPAASKDEDGGILALSKNATSPFIGQHFLVEWPRPRHGLE